MEDFVQFCSCGRLIYICTPAFPNRAGIGTETVDHPLKINIIGY